MMQAVAEFKGRTGRRKHGIDALVDELYLRQEGRKITGNHGMYERLRDASTIFDTNLKYTLRNELIHATGRYFPYPHYEQSFVEYVKEVLAAPVPNICIDTKEIPEIRQMVGLTLGNHYTQRGQGSQLLVGTLRNSYWHGEDIWGNAIEFGHHGDAIFECRIRDRLLRCAPILPGKNSEDGINPGDVVKMDPGVEGDNFWRPKNLYFVISRKDNEAAVIQIEIKEGKPVEEHCLNDPDIVYVPISTLTKHQLPYTDKRTQEEVKQIVYGTVTQFFYKEGLVAKGDLWRQILIKAADEKNRLRLQTRLEKSGVSVEDVTGFFKEITNLLESDSVARR